MCEPTWLDEKIDNKKQDNVYDNTQKLTPLDCTPLNELMISTLI